MDTSKKTDELWEEKKKKLMIKFPWPTAADLTFKAGGKDAMKANLQLILGKMQEDLRKTLDGLYA